MVTGHRTAFVEFGIGRRDRRHCCARCRTCLVGQLRFRPLVVPAAAVQLQCGAFEPVLLVGHETFHVGQRLAALDDAIQVRGHFCFVVDTTGGPTLAFTAVVLLAGDQLRQLFGQRMVLRAWRGGRIGINRRHVQVAGNVVHGACGEAAPMAVLPARHRGRPDRCGWWKQGTPQRCVDRIEQRCAFDGPVLVEQFDRQPRPCGLGPVHENAGSPQRAVGVGPDRR